MRRNIVILFFALMLTTACNPYETDWSKPRNIRLSAASGEIEVFTKAGVVEAVEADPYTGTTPNAGKSLTTTVWFNFEPGKYLDQHNQYQYIPCRTNIIFTGGNAVDAMLLNTSIRILYPIVTDDNYNDVGDNVYCVGLYPADGNGNSEWEYSLVDDSWSEVSRTIDGNDDIMFAEQMKGNYDDNFDKQNYKHLLTWVNINMRASSKNASRAWGTVDRVSIINPQDKIRIQLSDAIDDEGNLTGNSTVTYLGSEQEFLTSDDSKSVEDRTLGIVGKSFGSVFCAPPLEQKDGVYGYTIKVKTSLIPEEKEVFVPLVHIDDQEEIPLTDRSKAVGKLYVINLTFNDINVIEAICTLNTWEAQSNDVFLSPVTAD